MNKLQMAHQWAMKSIDAGYVCETDMLVKEAWKYADAMQAEADKRNIGERTLTKDESGNCLHFHHEFGHKKCLDCGASLEEWQPDWSQAPDWADYWFMDEDGVFWWSKGQPYFLANQVSKIVINNSNDIAPSFGYQGDWRNSLRKRPQGE